VNGGVPARAPLELWGGVECTVNRLGDAYLDQLARNGHPDRLDDLDRFAALGMRALRFPLLWERTMPEGPASADWRWGDRGLARVRELGVTPIVGLVHHGSGPRHTGLLDPRFADGVADYARRVAERYPWVEAYTPVNEPLTTARFSGLYGLWHPHARDAGAFAQALLNQCRAVVLAMRAIREVNPRARLVQTEDLGRVYSTPALAYQAAYENERRWASFDLLAGRLEPGGKMWRYLRQAGIRTSELEWFREHACAPDLLGINHYLSSERFLDQRLRRYPRHTWGGNGRHRYADVEAARVLAGGAAGPAALLQEAWDRYALPLAVTEVHNGCTREEQLRWFVEVWEAADTLQGRGVDVRAVCAWALLGSFDWNSLLTRAAGHYEPGVFDLRGPEPRPTALARVLRDLADGRPAAHPVLGAPGWWHRPQRLSYGPAVRDAGEQRRTAHLELALASGRRLRGPPLLITGATGTLGRAFARLCELRGLPHRLLARDEMDIADPSSVAAALEAHRPWALINAAGYVRVEDAEREPDRCLRENRDGPAVLAAACADRGLPLVTYSSDLVFAGDKGAPYVERDAPSPRTVYGRSKAEAERAVLARWPDALVVRTSAFFGPWDEYNFVTLALRALAAGRRWTAEEAVVSPTYVPDLVHASLDLLIDGERGIWHLANAGAASWAALARRAAELAGLDAGLVAARPGAAPAAPGVPPATVLGSERGVLLPTLDSALERYLDEMGPRLGLAAGGDAGPEGLEAEAPALEA